MDSRENDHQHSYVGTVSPDADGDTSDRTLTDQGDPSVTHGIDPAERAAKLQQLGQGEDAHGGLGGPGGVDADDLVDGGPTQAGGTADQPPAAADPGGEQP
jgi:hypothetical protein